MAKILPVTTHHLLPVNPQPGSLHSAPAKANVYVLCFSDPQQKIVIKVQMASDKCRSKAMALVASTGGVSSVALAGDGKDQVVVVGEGVDSIKLTEALRKKVGDAHLLQVAEDKKPADPVAAAIAEYNSQWYHHYYHPPPHPVVYDHHAAAYGCYYSQPDTSCSIM